MRDDRIEGVVKTTTISCIHHKRQNKCNYRKTLKLDFYKHSEQCKL